MAACQHRRPSEVLHTPSTRIDLTNSVQTFRGTDLWVCLREPRPMRHDGPMGAGVAGCAHKNRGTTDRIGMLYLEI